MFWKAGLKITPVYKESGGSLSPSLARKPAGRRAEQVVWGLSGANSLSLGPGAGKTAKSRVPRLPRLQNLRRVGTCGCSCFKSFFSSKKFNLPALSGERRLSWGSGCARTHTGSGTGRQGSKPGSATYAGSQFPHQDQQ